MSSVCKTKLFSSPCDEKTTKTITRTGNVTTFTDTENDASEIIVPKRQFFDRLKHNKFIMDQYKKDVIQYKTERDTLKLQLKELEAVADKQLTLRKDLEKQVKQVSDELSLIKSSKHPSKCDIDMLQTDDINEINKLIEEEVRRNLERNKTKILDPYLENLHKKYMV